MAANYLIVRLGCRYQGPARMLEANGALTVGQHDPTEQVLRCLDRMEAALARGRP
jgi:hypothetical protein